MPAEGSSTRSDGGQRGRLGGDKAERDRRRELLEAARIPRSAGSATASRSASRGACRASLRANRRGRASPHRICAGTAPGRLQRLVGVLPHPGALGVGAGKRRLHRRAQGAAIERPALAELMREQGGGMDEARHLVDRRLRLEQRESDRGGCRGLGNGRHARVLRESGAGRRNPRSSPGRRPGEGSLSLVPGLTRRLRPFPSSRLDAAGSGSRLKTSRVPPDQVQQCSCGRCSRASETKWLRPPT